MNLQEFTRKAKYGVFIPKKVTRKPWNIGSVISDLFPLRTGDGWTTFFEILDIPGLLNGSFSDTSRHKILFVFFDQDGNEIGRKHFPSPTEPRYSLELSTSFFKEIDKACTFSVFHTNFEPLDNLGDSFLAERGYSGYKRNNMPIRGYVHGNLDSIAWHLGEMQMLGNAGILRRSYLVQHPFSGESKYELFLTNPCNQKVRIRVQVRSPKSSWKDFETFILNPRGCQKISIDVGENEVKFIRIVSRLYLGRPVIFRCNENSMDVFHG